MTQEKIKIRGGGYWGIFREMCDYNSPGAKEGPPRRCHLSRDSKGVQEQTTQVSGGTLFPQREQHVQRP